MNEALKNDISALTARINEYIAKFGLTARCGLDFGYYYAEDLIEYAILVPNSFDESFKQYLTRYSIEAPIFIWSLFHEIGHAETDDYYTTEAHCMFDEYKAALNPDNPEDVMEYYNTPDEAAATNWAYLYIRDNYNEVVGFWEEISAMIQAIYKKYEISI